ncbi:MAG: glutaredoxin family protein [Anaerolineae bacterium]|nr:glutaredoxin family protein [Anaerolineae bacterium]
MAKELVMYTRTAGCPFVTIAKKVLHEHQIPYREIFVDQDPDARQRLLDWVGFLSVPTLIVAEPGHNLPFAEAEPLERGVSPRGIDRGSMLTEPSASQFRAWLTQHQFLRPASVD